MSTKIVQMTSVHPPFDIRIFSKECLTLANEGYEVVLIVPHTHDELRDGVQLRHVKKADNRFIRMFVTTWKVAYKALKEKGAVYHFHDPELLPAGIILSLLGKRVVYDVHESVPKQILDKEWLHPWIRRPISAIAASFEKVGARLFSGIVCATPAIARAFPQNKTALLQNFPVTGELLRENSTVDDYVKRPQAMAYVGCITALRGAHEMVKGLEKAQYGERMSLVLAGMFQPPDLENEVSVCDGWSQVDYRGWQDRGQIARMLGSVRAGLVLFHPAKNHIEAQPNKLFEYMSAGLPVIASDFPVWREIVEETGSGLLVDPLDSEAIARAYDWILDHPDEAAKMGQSGREAVTNRFNWGVESQKLISLYKNLTQ